MKLRLAAFFFCAMSLTMMIGVYSFSDGAKALPNQQHGRGTDYSLDLSILVLSLMALGFAIAGGFLLFKDARAGGKAARRSGLFRCSALCLVPAIFYSISAYVLPLIRPW